MNRKLFVIVAFLTSWLMVSCVGDVATDLTPTSAEAAITSSRVPTTVSITPEPSRVPTEMTRPTSIPTTPNMARRPYLIISRQGDLLNPLTSVHVVWDENTRESEEISDFAGTSASWSPDVDALLFSRIDTQTGDWRLSVLSRNDPAPVDLLVELPSGARPTEPTWSSDGRRIAFVDSQDMSRPQILVFHLDTQELQQIADGVSPAWSPTSNEISYVAPEKDLEPYGNLSVLDLDTGTTLAIAFPGVAASPVWSDDGEHLLFSALHVDQSVVTTAIWNRRTGQIVEYNIPSTSVPVWGFVEGSVLAIENGLVRQHDLASGGVSDLEFPFPGHVLFVLPSR